MTILGEEVGKAFEDSMMATIGFERTLRKENSLLKQRLKDIKAAVKSVRRAPWWKRIGALRELVESLDKMKEIKRDDAAK